MQRRPLPNLVHRRPVAVAATADPAPWARPLFWLVGLALITIGLTLGLNSPAAGQSSRSVDPGPARDSGPATAPDRSPQSRSDDASRQLSPRTVILTERPQRPLRTFRGQAVRVGSYAETEKSIGVVRPLRTYPLDDARTGITRPNRFGDAERWTTRYVAPGRLVLQAYPNVYGNAANLSYGNSGLTGPERSIGVVRAYRLPDRPQRFGPVTLTGNDEASSNADASSSDAGTTPPRDIRVTAVGEVAVPGELRDDAWALLNAGYYREARRQFDQNDADDSAAQQTGRAVAAALAGDLNAAAELLPESATLPDRVTLSDATRRRLQQTTQYLMADQPELQSRFQQLLDQAPQAF